MVRVPTNHTEANCTFTFASMDKSLVKYNRKSFIEIGEIYFWTATINNWHRLLLQDKYKDVIIESLQYLSSNNKIDVFAFVIMPNHIHLIWRTKELNGRETAQGSFLKYTAHEFKKLLRKNHQNLYHSLQYRQTIKVMNSGNGI